MLLSIQKIVQYLHRQIVLKRASPKETVYEKFNSFLCSFLLQNHISWGWICHQKMHHTLLEIIFFIYGYLFL